MQRILKTLIVNGNGHMQIGRMGYNIAIILVDLCDSCRIGKATYTWGAQIYRNGIILKEGFQAGVALSKSLLQETCTKIKLIVYAVNTVSYTHLDVYERQS